MEEIKENRIEGFWRLTFLHNTKPSLFGKLKNCIGGGFWRFIWILQI